MAKPNGRRNEVPENDGMTLRAASGPYRAGLVLTDDSSFPCDPDGAGPVFVDPVRLARFRELGLLGAPPAAPASESEIIPEPEPPAPEPEIVTEDQPGGVPEGEF